MNRLVLTVAAASTVFLAACGGGEVIVQAQLDGESGPVPLKELPVRILPYDRDAIFDSLRSAYATPEPEIPADLLALQDSISAAQNEWSSTQARWAAARDSQKVLSDRLKTLSPASGEYVVLFRDYGAQEATAAAADRAMNVAFQRFDALSKRFTTQSEEIRLSREQWADAAYADVDDAITAKLRNLKREPIADTLTSNGVGRVKKVPKGTWWVVARYELPFEELYWNVPVEVKGEPVTVQLTRQTAQVRPKL